MFVFLSSGHELMPPIKLPNDFNFFARFGWMLTNGRKHNMAEVSLEENSAEQGNYCMKRGSAHVRHWSQANHGLLINFNDYHVK